MADYNPQETSPLLASSSSKKVILNVPDNDDVAPPSRKVGTPRPPEESYKAGIALMLFITFLSSICFSIVLPSIWPFLDKKMHASYSIVGWAVAVNSAGSFLASPLFGSWADRRSTKEVLAVSLCVMIIGNVLYSLSTNIWMLLAGRFVVGVAAGNYAVAQSYLSYATTTENRTQVMAFNSGATVLGFIIGPSFALLTTFIHFNVGGIQVNDYTSPGYLSAIMSIGGLFSLFLLKEISPSTKRRRPVSTGSSTYGSGFYSGAGSVKDLSQILRMNKAKVPILPVCICLFAYFSYTTSFTVFETIGTPYTEKAFNWSVQKNSILYVVLGAICVVSLVLLQVFVRFFNDRILLIATTSFSVIGFGTLVNPTGEYVPLWRFAIALTFSAASYSTSVAILISIYSKQLEGLDQGVMMGWLSSSGSVARIIGPIIASYLLDYGGPRYVFMTMAMMMGVTFIIVGISYRALTPKVEAKKTINA